MKKMITMAVVGLSLTALVGCSSSNTSAKNSNSTDQASQQQDTNANGKSPANGQQGGRRGQGMLQNQELLTLLKTDSKTLQDELKGGKSLADIATEKGVAEQQVIDLLVKQSQQRTDEAVKSGKLTQDKADQMKEKEQDRIKQQVEHKGGFTGNAQGNQQRRQKQNSSDTNTNNTTNNNNSNTNTNTTN